MNKQNRAVFLDRDGVIIKDSNLLTETSEVAFIPDTLEALKKLKELGFLLIVVTNQTVVSRGLTTETGVHKVHLFINNQLEGLIDKFYYCPHHPNATLEEFRKDCNCRKPKPGMLKDSANEFNINLTASWMIGDRVSDIVAGKAAGCKTIQVLSGEHKASPIISNAMPEALPEPDYLAESLFSATKIITENA